MENSIELYHLGEVVSDYLHYYRAVGFIPFSLTCKSLVVHIKAVPRIVCLNDCQKVARKMSSSKWLSINDVIKEEDLQHHVLKDYTVVYVNSMFLAMHYVHIMNSKFVHCNSMLRLYYPKLNSNDALNTELKEKVDKMVSGLVSVYVRGDFPIEYLPNSERLIIEQTRDTQILCPEIISLDKVNSFWFTMLVPKDGGLIKIPKNIEKLSGNIDNLDITSLFHLKELDIRGASLRHGYNFLGFTQLRKLSIDGVGKPLSVPASVMSLSLYVYKEHIDLKHLVNLKKLEVHSRRLKPHRSNFNISKLKISFPSHLKKVTINETIVLIK